MITANEAREFKKKGIVQDEVLMAALDRCQAAIIDQSKKGKAWVEVAVFDLDDTSFKKLTKHVEKSGYDVKKDARLNERTHVLTIVWDKDETK